MDVAGSIDVTYKSKRRLLFESPFFMLMRCKILTEFSPSPLLPGALTSAKEK